MIKLERIGQAVEHTDRTKLGQGGQALIVLTIMMSVLGGMLAMSVDSGFIFQGRRGLQNAADAGALAGVQELPSNPSLAKDKAREWLGKPRVYAQHKHTV